jgi:SAM-dependent methyltransferase
MNTRKINATAESYDSMPYTSYPFPYTRPEYLRSMALVFGLNPADVEKARVLEIGCASGMSLIPFAESNPKAHCVGIDISKVEIEHGKQIVSDLGLKNVDLQHFSISDITDDFGKFDYIICHGVYSWVDEAIRDKILAICKNNLNKNGLALISYNTFPGWNMVTTVRDMMKFHSSMFASDSERLVQAKALVSFIQENLSATHTPFAKFLSAEANHINSQQDSYVFHEYLAEENYPIYFYQFIDLIKAKKLNYVCDTNIASMFSGNLPPKAAEALSKVPDIIRSEQYLDFIHNRRFRLSIVCHEEQQINYNINPDVLDSFYLSLNIKPAEDSSGKFYLNNNKEIFITTDDQGLQAVLHAFAEMGNYPAKFSEIISLAAAKFDKLNIAAAQPQIKGELVKLLFSGHLTITATKPDYINAISKHPKISKLARYQAEKAGNNNLWVTNQKSEIYNIDVFEKHLLTYLDGKHAKKDLLSQLIKDHQEKKFNMHLDGVELTGEGDIKKQIENLINAYLEKLRVSSILVA